MSLNQKIKELLAKAKEISDAQEAARAAEQKAKALAAEHEVAAREVRNLAFGNRSVAEGILPVIVTVEGKAYVINPTAPDGGLVREVEVRK